MANADRARGLEPVGSVLRCQPYVAAAACYPGDLLERTDAGKVQPIATGTAGAQIVGVAMSYASADAAEVMVADHPDQLFVIQAEDGSIDAQTDIGLNYDVANTAGSSTYKISRMEIDSSTAGATTAATPLCLVRIQPRPDNALGTNVDCIVSLNMHVYSNAGGNAGI